MVRRHPHVFGDVVADTAEDVAANWETWKRQQKPARTSVLDGVPAGLPALARAEKVLIRGRFGRRIGLAIMEKAGHGVGLKRAPAHFSQGKNGVSVP